VLDLGEFVSRYIHWFRTSVGNFSRYVTD